MVRFCPGMFEMHGHLGETAAFLNIAAGVTSVRDMGNNNEVPGPADRGISARAASPARASIPQCLQSRAVSPFNSNSGVLVATEEEAVQAVHDHADRGDFSTRSRSTNSMRPTGYLPSSAAARERGMRVIGHIPRLHQCRCR